MIECTVEITINDNLGIISEARDNVLKQLFRQVISKRPACHDTRGCNGKYFNELFGKGVELE